MVNCDFTEAKFIPKPDQLRYSYLLNDRFERVKFVNTEFHHVRFDSVSFIDCLLRGIVLEDVKMPATTLFSFYSHGHRDFNGVKRLKGKIPDKLPPFPLSDAALSKEVFVQLYRQGLRDFRASNLLSFYLSETLAAQAISEIDLKLEGASYRQSLLGCGRSHSSRKRSVRMQHSVTAARCVFYFLVQKPGLLPEKAISLADITRLAAEESSDITRKLVIKEINFEHKSLFLLENPDEIKFYWGYQADDGSLIKAIDFTRQSTRPPEREKSYITFYFTKKFTSDTPLKVLASDIRHLGFRQGQLNYYTAQGQFAALDLQANPMSLPHYTYLDSKFISILKDEKPVLSAGKRITEEKQRSQLYRIAADMKRRAKSGFRAGTREGAHYELGFALMYFIASWITQKEAPTPKRLDSTTKEELKRYAEQIVKEEAGKRQASDYITDLVQDVVNQCIDRGECSTQQLVRENIIDTLQYVRPDIQVGYEGLWNKIKILFMDTGRYLSEKFAVIKEIFKEIDAEQPQLARKLSVPPVSLIIYSSGLRRVRPKRTLRQWYDSPLLVGFIKTLESLFAELGYDLKQVADFSEAELAGFLYELWIALENCGITRYSEIKTIINLLDDNCFRNSVLQGALHHGAQACLTDTGCNATVWQEEVDLTVAEEAKNETDVQSRKKRNVLSSHDVSLWTSFATSVAQRSTPWLNSFINAMYAAFFSLKNSNAFYAEKTQPIEKLLLDDTFLTVPYVQQFKQAIVHKTSHYKQNDSKQELCSLNTPALFAGINNSLVLANFSLQVFTSFFANRSHAKKINKTTVSFCNKVVAEVKALIKKFAKTNGISLVNIYEKAMLLDFQNELYTSSVCETATWKKAIFHFRNRICQRMLTQNVATLKKFRFLSQFNEAIRDRFISTQRYFLTDFSFFQLNKLAVESEFLEKNAHLCAIKNN